MKYQLYKTLQGTNGHVLRIQVNQPRKRAYIVLALFFTVLAGATVIWLQQFVADTFRFQAYAPIHPISPLAQKAYAAEPTEHDLIVSYIKEVFGKDSDKAFHLLQDCGENSALNPNAVNTFNNVPEGSRDIGVFMINEYWQKTQAKFLFNWKINIQIAKQLFDENHGTFNLWTGGRKCGI